MVYSLLCLGLGLCLSLGFRLCCGSSSGSGGLHHGLRGIGIVLQREQDDVLGALLGAHTAALALVVINACHAVHNMDSVELTGALAHTAGDAGGGAQLVCHSTLILVGAHDHRLAGAGSVDHDDLLGADVGTGTTAGALVLVHLCHTVYDVDGVELTHLGAVAQTNAGEGAGLGAAVQSCRSSTSLDALVVVGGFAVLGAALTLHHSLLFYGACLAAHDLGNGSSSLGAAGCALVAGHAVQNNCLGVVGTAGVAAAAAVCKSMTSHHTAKDFKAGDTVHVISMDTTGTVTAPADSKGNIKVQMGILSSLLPASDLVIIETPKQNNAQVSINNKRGMSKALNIQPEINVLGMTVAEATSLVDRYLDDAMMAHLHKVRIIHGKGTGALRKGIHDYLRKQSYVKSFRLGEYGEGEAGVTIVEL